MAKASKDSAAWGRNVHPCGWDVDSVLLGRVVNFGEVVEMTADQLAELVSTGNFEAADEAAFTAQKEN